MLRTVQLFAVCFGVASLLSGCELLSAPTDIDLEDVIDLPSTPEFPFIIGEPYGGPCELLTDCRAGLSCVGGQCGLEEPRPSNPDCLGPEPCGTDLDGDGTPDDFPFHCISSLECEPGHLCQIDIEELAAGFTPGAPYPPAYCVPRGDSPENGSCSLDIDCADGLRCTYLGFTGICTPDGTLDYGQSCTDTSECVAPLTCSIPPPEVGGIGEPTCFFPTEIIMPGAECADLVEDGPLEAYFDIPRGEPLGEFYRLPFPNDIRRSGDGIDMSGHYNPGRQYVGGDLVDLYLDSVSGMQGFSTNPTVYFRTSTILDFGSVTGADESSTLHFYNIDPGSPGYGRRLPMSWFIQPNQQKFICDNSIQVRSSWAAPLDHGTTYAAWLTTGIRGRNGETPSASSDFIAMLEGNAPGGDLDNAWTTYQPLRDFFADAETPFDGSDVVSAAVFTTHDPDAEMAAIRAGVRAQPAPTLRDVTVCAEGVSSPCEALEGAEGERGCSGTEGAFTEIHAILDAPVVQAGARPFLLDTDGGALEFNGDEVTVQATEELCVSITVPTGEAPESGWPTVMFAHGTGGTFLSHISGGTAGEVAEISLPEGDTVGLASISIDGAQHATRRGGSELDPETLFYNFVNPLAARGNVQQGAADYFHLAYLLDDLSLDIDNTSVRFDPSQRYFFGHSQGATVGGLFAPYEPSVRAAVFSGAGGSLTLSLLNKTSPEDIAGAVDTALSSSLPGQPIDATNEYHPLLALLQWWVDAVDPLNYARLAFRAPLSEESTGLHVFMSYGYGDTYTPEANQRVYGQASSLRVASPFEGDLGGFGESPYPVSGNAAANGNPVTAVIVPGVPGDYDGHFVIFRNDEVRDDAMEFLGTAVRDGVPTITR